MMHIPNNIFFVHWSDEKPPSAGASAPVEGQHTISRPRANTEENMSPALDSEITVGVQLAMQLLLCAKKLISSFKVAGFKGQR